MAPIVLGIFIWFYISASIAESIAKKTGSDNPNPDFFDKLVHVIKILFLAALIFASPIFLLYLIFSK